MLDRVTKEFSIGAYLVAKQILRLGIKSGWLFVSLYLKQCSACLMSFRGSDIPLDRNESVPVNLNKSGLPRIIPSFHRKMILRRDPKADIIIRFYLSIFSINRLIPLSKRVTRNTFSTMVEPVKDLDTVMDVVSELKSCLPSLVSRYLPHVWEIPLNLGLEFQPTWKALQEERTLVHLI